MTFGIGIYQTAREALQLLLLTTLVVCTLLAVVVTLPFVLVAMVAGRPRRAVDDIP